MHHLPLWCFNSTWHHLLLLHATKHNLSHSKVYVFLGFSCLTAFNACPFFISFSFFRLLYTCTLFTYINIFIFKLSQSIGCNLYAIFLVAEILMPDYRMPLQKKKSGSTESKQGKKKKERKKPMKQ